MKFLRYIFVLVAIASSVELFGQNISEEYEDKSVAYILEDIGKRYTLSFAYDSYALGSIKGSWVFHDEVLFRVLETLLMPNNFGWKEVSSTYVIYARAPLPEIIPSEIGSDEKLLFGEVRDIKSRELLPFAIVTTPDGRYSVTTNTDGKFIINRNYIKDSLIVYYLGYDRNIIEASDLDVNSYLRVFLTPRDSYLPTVMVEAAKIRLINISAMPSIQTINPNSITGLIGGGEPDIYRSVQMLPGIAGTLESNNGLFVRGSNSDQTLITFDGFTLYQQDHFFGAFSAVNATAVKNMRIHKGNMEVRFGGRTAGVLEIVGNEGGAKKTRTQLDIGPLAVAGLLETSLDQEGKVSVVIAGRRSFTNSVFSPTYKSMFNTVYNASVNLSSDGNLQTFGQAQDPEFFFQDLNVKLTYRSSERDVINLSFFAAKDKLYMQYADTADYEVVNLRDINYTDESVKRNIGAGARWVRRWRNNWESLISLGYSRFSGDFFSVDSIRNIAFGDTTVMFYAENATLEDIDARAEMNYAAASHRLQIGMQLNQMSTDNRLNYAGISTPGRSQQGSIVSLYIQEEWEPTERLKVRPGIRINYFNLTDRLDPEPRVAMSYVVVPSHIRVRASAGIVHQYIHRIREQSIYFNTPDYWQFSGNDNLPVLRSIQYAAGVNATLGSWTLDVESYLKQNNGLFVNTGIYGRTDSARYQSQIWSGEGMTYGTDVLLEHNWKKQHAWISYSLMYARSEFETDEGLQAIREPFIRQHEAKFYYQYQPRRWSFSAFWVFGSGKPYTPYLGNYAFNLPNGTSRSLPVFGRLNSGILEPYHRLDISAAYHFNMKRAEGKLQFSIFNVYDRKNVRDIQYIAVRESVENNDYKVVERKVNMLPFLPNLNLQLRF